VHIERKIAPTEPAKPPAIARLRYVRAVALVAMGLSGSMPVKIATATKAAIATNHAAIADPTILRKLAPPFRPKAFKQMARAKPKIAPSWYGPPIPNVAPESSAETRPRYSVFGKGQRGDPSGGIDKGTAL